MVASIWSDDSFVGFVYCNFGSCLKWVNYHNGPVFFSLQCTMLIGHIMALCLCKSLSVTGCE